MTYLSIVEMAGSPSLLTRIVAAVADEGYPGDPLGFARDRIWHIVAEDSGWASSWDSARAGASTNVNPDTGMRDDVITDSMILAVVQPLVAQVTPVPEDHGPDTSQGPVG